MIVCPFPRNTVHNYAHLYNTTSVMLLNNILYVNRRIMMPDNSLIYRLKQNFKGKQIFQKQQN